MVKPIKSDITGINIHSPFVYRLVANVVFAPYPFHAFSEIENLSENKYICFEHQLIFRLVNHFRVNEAIIFGGFDAALETVCRMANRNIEINYNITAPETVYLDDYSRLVIIDNPAILAGNYKHPNVLEIFVLRRLKETGSKHYFENLIKHSRPEISVRLNQTGIVIFNEIFNKQDYVIKHRV